ncbi:MAG: lysophospholipid acyltransferase family protein [Melioribacteraceae bacterium]
MKLSHNQKNILRFLGIRIASFLINVLLKTVRLRIENSDVVKELDKQKKNYVVAFWHGSMLIGWFMQRNRNFASLVSKSKDGDVLTAILEKWDFHVVRGSSSKGGHEALDMMIHLTEENYHLALTPDGPTGPIYKMKPGAVITARRSQIPLLLVGIGMKSKWSLKSWDKFEIPKPFSAVTAIYSQPIMIPAILTKEETSEVIDKCEAELNNLQKEALNR